MTGHRKIIGGFVAGAALGLAIHASGSTQALTGFLDWVVQPVGRLFLRLLFMSVLPLVVSSLILGVSEMGDAARLGRVAVKTLALTVVVTGISVLTGLFAVELLRPGTGFPVDVREALIKSGTLPATPPAAPANAADRLLNLLPQNPFKAAADGDVLGLMFFSLLFGVGILMAGREKTATLLKVFEGIFEASMGFVGLVMKLAPLGVGCLVLNLTARFGYELLAHLLGYAAVVVGALAFHQFVTYSALVQAFGGMSAVDFFRRTREAMITAFGTSSSSVTLPISLKVCEEDLKVPRDVGRFVLTVGASANQNGTALYEGVTALFLAQCFGVDLNLGQKATVLMLAVLGGVGTAGVPGGSLPMLMAILGSIGVPVEGVLLILGIDRFLDMCRTVLNVTGDLLIAVLVGRWEGRARRVQA
ncbi:MAG: dicarboxylate/amino acid:cation symporter [Elusimicrobia bacterium]|nr:dicarboxylate/amino acid:cation symporter [Elusimicrobiota bacterium]